MIKDSSVTIKSISTFFLLLLFCGNAVFWKLQENSAKNLRIFPQLMHNTLKNRQKRPTSPHYRQTFSHRLFKWGEKSYLISEVEPFAFAFTFTQFLRRLLSISTQFVFFNIPTISGYFLFYNEAEVEDMGLKKIFQFLRKKAKGAFIFLSFMVYINGNSNCRRPGILIVVDHRGAVFSKRAPLPPEAEYFHGS